MAKDFFHDHVRAALEQSGWTITDDPLTYDFGFTSYKIDLGAEQMFGARKGPELIAVEVKSFLGPSKVYQLHAAFGQYLNYKAALMQKDPERKLVLAVPMELYDSLLKEELIKVSLVALSATLLLYDPEDIKNVAWKKY